MKKAVVLCVTMICASSSSVFAQGKAPSPTPDGNRTSYVSDNGTTTIASFRVRYARRGASRVEGSAGAGYTAQELRVSNARQPDSDALLLTFAIQGGNLYVDGTCVVVSEDSTAFPVLGTATLKLSGAVGALEMFVFPPGFAGLYMEPEPQRAAVRVLVFRLPPTSGRVTLRGLGGFSPVLVNVR